MVQWQEVDEATVLRLTQTLLSLEPLLLTASIQQVAAKAGWVVTRFDPEWPSGGASLDTGCGLGSSSAFFNTDADAKVTSISANVTEDVTGGGSAADEYKLDAFALAASALTSALGQPDRPQPGERPRLWWQRDTTWLGLVTKRDAVGLQLTPAERMVGKWE
ncbi:hypothetical protein ACWT_3414 [Actinoplanes sp. SE50]|uniref:DUF6301 family protein n=1 Tax=unclassified Actinoplanes TaxID=2626549 RepID=UPI00023ED432|nr:MULTISPECIES: DUF6301 family protein [unclassified Actinoplanes]AEV84437.1 hypothetical protein ACPL_3542 [Actinoplanes sp. SE50/110]ATO82829.1 hypothetical protein ACWT_3414 [Actinoplanes sp. SE50]SLM00237.1 uncharacterized protein ACSP50_3469 [Actinoplanes sp. SE50/110]